ncbi:MAG: hypothetical protein AAFQ98_21900 [Bacteroidota bacterium]
MTNEQKALWERIKKFTIGDPRAAFAFPDRLARENGWPLAYAHRVLMEYKRFMFLICVVDHPLTPSDQVDQAWHLHLLYTQSYWQDFCKKTLGREVHHGPTKGGQEEKDKFDDWYALTKSKYQDYFGVQPPSDIWPSATVRFGQIRFQRVNLHRHWIIRKPKWL